mgnify:CR=1 FL=1
MSVLFSNFDETQDNFRLMRGNINPTYNFTVVNTVTVDAVKF